MGEAIKKLYTSKGLTPPKGKGIHTFAFHKVASRLMKEGKVDNPFAVAMAQLGRNKAVNPSHRTINPAQTLKKRKP